MENKKCPVEYTIDILKNRWTILILRELLDKHELTFNQFLKHINFISNKVLDQNLKRLIKNGIVEKVSKTINRKVYILSELGKTLKPVIDSLRDWGIKNMNK